MFALAQRRNQIPAGRCRECSETADVAIARPHVGLREKHDNARLSQLQGGEIDRRSQRAASASCASLVVVDRIIDQSTGLSNCSHAHLTRSRYCPSLANGSGENVAMSVTTSEGRLLRTLKPTATSCSKPKSKIWRKQTPKTFQRFCVTLPVHEFDGFCLAIDRQAGPYRSICQTTRLARSLDRRVSAS